MSLCERRYTLTDRVLIHFDRALKTLSVSHLGERPNPADEVEDESMTAGECSQSAGLMRVNHSGEVCAQALYQGQAITARQREVQQKLQQSADEENDHLDWCRQRLQALGSHTSYLNWLWYLGSLGIGVIAGLAGDRWSLGFVAETERQVVAHLERHLEQLPQSDHRSRRIIETMRDEEGYHATVALEYGAAELPSPIRVAMRFCSKVMTNTAYWL